MRSSATNRPKNTAHTPCRSNTQAAPAVPRECAPATVTPVDWLLYGANGYTGGLVARLAVERGLRPILAGRRAEPVARLAAELGLPYRIADLASPSALDGALDGV